MDLEENMQQNDHRDFVQDLSRLLGDKDKVDHLKVKVADMDRDGRLMSLLTDEFNLLMDYRNWKISDKSGTGVFHWRVDRKERH